MPGASCGRLRRRTDSQGLKWENLAQFDKKACEIAGGRGFVLRRYTVRPHL
ncbi:MAG: hypothetical protein CM15mP74_35500 [Halieaceae bacterium]|nr:MAG: hypothetical protein CM15mP74_35500 [Halieaceae bacterium]